MGREKTIFVISPMYLEVIIKEAKKFMFDLQGYGSFALAKDGILKVNACDLLGFAFVSDSVPKIGSEEYKSMMEFLNLCNLMGNFKFTLVLRNSLSSKYVEKIKGFKNLSFYLANGFEYVTDSVIHSNVFGSLLMTSVDPYVLKAEEPIQPRNFECPTLKLNIPVSGYVLNCLLPISKLTSVSQTLEYDSVYQDYVRDNSILADLRKVMIQKEFAENCVNELSVLRSKLEVMVSSGDVSPMYLALCDLIAEDVSG